MTPLSSPNQQEPERMFLGEYERGVDSKGRITLPATLRDALGDESAVLTRGLDRCLFLFTRSSFEVWRQKIRDLPMTDRQSRNLRRHVFSGAAEVRPDSQGRINLPPYLREYADLDGAAIVAGNDSYIEIWDALRWSEMRSQFEESAADAEAWDELGI